MNKKGGSIIQFTYNQFANLEKQDTGESLNFYKTWHHAPCLGVYPKHIWDSWDFNYPCESTFDEQIDEMWQWQ